jgi:hypothetical protein
LQAGVLLVSCFHVFNEAIPLQQNGLADGSSAGDRVQGTRPDDSGDGHGTETDGTADGGGLVGHANDGDGWLGSGSLDAGLDANATGEGPSPSAVDAVAEPESAMDASAPILDSSRRDTNSDAHAGSISLLQSFDSPGTTTEGITWDGSHVWVSDNSATLFELSTSGNLVASFSAPEGTPEGITWDGSDLWLYTTNRSFIYQLVSEDGGLSQLRSFQAPTQVIGGDITNDLTWDGASLWYANEYKVYHLSNTGSILGSFSFPRNVSGIDWDGAHFWIANRDTSGSQVFSVADTDGHILATFPSPVGDVQAIAWGNGNHIWGFGYAASLVQTVIFELDASSAKASVP